MHYPWDPRLKTYEELKATEFISQKIIDQIMKSLHPDKKGKLSNQSWLIYGARGMGKSHALTLIYHKIKEDEKLSEKWIPILCPEELFTVNSLYRLFKKFASLIISELACQKSIINCDKLKSEIEILDKTKITGNANQRKEQENELSKKYLNVFLELSKSVKRKFIFLIENLQEVFSKQINEDDQKRLRDMFYQYPDLMIWIASAVQIPGKLSDYGKPFYHFFRTRKLEGMNSDEIMKMLNNFCDVYRADKLKKNLEEMKSDISVFGLLSGGNPRLIMLLYKFLENGAVKGIKDMMKIFISDLTPYFQKETESLPHQQRLIIDSLCLHIFPLLSAKDIAESCNLPDNIVNSQVNKLKVTHWLRTEKINQLKNEFFILNEYIYRVWYQMRVGGIYQEQARWVSEFLSFIYPAEKIQKKIGELKNLASNKKIEDEVFIRSEIEIYKKALEWQEKNEVKQYFQTIRKKKIEVKNETSIIFDLMDRKEFKKAISELEKIMASNPNKNYYDLHGFINVNLNNHKDAIADYSKAIKTETKEFMLYNARGLSYSVLLQHDKAIKDFSKSIELNPKRARTYFERGINYKMINQYKNAIIDLSKAIELNSNKSDFYYVRGLCYTELKQLEKAISDYSRAIELNPKHAMAFHYRSLAYGLLQKYDKANKDSTKAIELNPENVYGYVNRAGSLIGLGKFHDSLKDFRLFILRTNNLSLIKKFFEILFIYIEDNYKVSESLKKLFAKRISKKDRLKHILLLTYYNQNEIIKTHLSENGFAIFKGKDNPYPILISFTILFNLIESIKSDDPKCMEFTELWINVISNIEFENEDQAEDIFNKSLMMIYLYAVQNKNIKTVKKVLEQIDEKYHQIAESHFYIPLALVEEKNPDVQRMMKDPIFKETVEKIKIQRNLSDN